nr:uncharacterized protein LOC124811581 [Hydra vulgaris]
MTLPHALQRDSISCGVFCLKFAENFMNGEELAMSFPLEEVVQYRNKVVHYLIDRGGLHNWKDVLCRICSNAKRPKKYKKQIINKWIKCDKCLPSRWYHMDCIPNVTESSKSFTCTNLSQNNQLN